MRSSRHQTVESARQPTVAELVLTLAAVDQLPAPDWSSPLYRRIAILPKCLYPRNEVADLATDDRVRTFVLPGSLFGNQHHDRPGDGIFTEFYLDQLPLLALLQYPFVAHPGSPCERSLSSFSVNSDRQFRGIKIVNISSFSLENTVLNKYFPCGSCTRKSSLQGHVVFTAPAMTTPRPDTTAIQRRSSSVAEFTVHSAKARQTT